MYNPHYNRYLMYGERYPTPAEPAQPPYGVDGLYPMPSGRDPMAMAPPYIPGAVMSEPSVGPMPGPSSLDTAMADAGGQGEELQRMLDRALQEDFLGGASMPRMSADAGGPQPQGRGARSKPPSKMQQKVMSMFPGGMGEYNAWHNGLPASAKEGKKLNNWSKVYKHLMENPRSAPGAAPASRLPFNMMENLEATPGPEPGPAGAPVGGVSSVGEGAVVPSAGSITAAAEDSGSLIGPAMPNPLGALAGVVGSGLKSYGQAMAPGVFGYPGASEATPVPPEAVVPAGPMFDMASNLEAAPAPYDPRSPEEQLRNPMPPGVNYRYNMARNLLPEQMGVAGPAFDMATNLEAVPSPYDPRPPEEQALNPMPPGVNYRYNMARNLLPGPAVTDGPQFDPRSATQQEMDPMPPGANYSYNMASPRHLMGGDAASTPYAPGPPEAPMGELQAPPMDLSGYVASMQAPLQAPPMDLSDYVNEKTYEQWASTIPKISRSDVPEHLRHALPGGSRQAAAGREAPPTSMGVQETAMAAAGGESALDYFQGAMELGLEAGLSQEQAADEALRMAQNMNPESWSGYELPLTPEEQSRKMRHLKRAAGARRRRYPSEVRAEEIQGQSQEIARLMREGQRDYRDAEDRSREIQGTSQDIARLMREENRKKHRSQEEIMMMADRLRDSGTLHAPGPMGSRHTAGYQPLPGMPGEEDRSHWRQLPPLDLYEYRKRMMMEMLLDGTNGGISSDPDAYDPMLGR